MTKNINPNTVNFKPLSWFQKCLFLQKQVEVLTRVIVKRNTELKQLKCDYLHGKTEVQKIKNLRKQLRYQKAKNERYETRYMNLLTRFRVFKPEESYEVIKPIKQQKDSYAACKHNLDTLIEGDCEYCTICGLLVKNNVKKQKNER